MPQTPALLRILLRLGTVVLLALCVIWLTRWAYAMTDAGATTHFQIGLLGLLLLAYVVMIALPFVPGVELGLTLMALQGGAIAPMVYLATVLGLMLAYLVGRILPPERIAGGLQDLRLHRAARMVRHIAPLDGQARIDLLVARLPGWLTPLALRHRYILLGLLINLPGNALIGGGGGIGLIAGLSRIYAALPTLLTFLIAVSPIPLLVWAYGMPILPFFK
jgi:hypothetical protein